MQEDTRNRVLKLIQDKVPGFHPIVGLAEIAADESNDLSLRVSCMKTIAPYCEATLKSVEIKGDVKHDFGVLRVSVYDGAKETDDWADEA